MIARYRGLRVTGVFRRRFRAGVESSGRRKGNGGGGSSGRSTPHAASRGQGGWALGGGCCPACLGLRTPCLPQRDEVDRLQEHRRKSTVTSHVRKDITRKWEQDAGTLDQQYRLDRIVWQAAQGEDTGVGQFGDEHRRGHRG